MKHKRKDIEAYIISLIKDLDDDPNGNIKQYEEFFKGLSDSQFNKWFTKLKNGEEKLFFYLPNFVKNITNEQLFKVAKKHNVKLRHRLVLTDNSNRKYLSKYEYFVLKLPVRRVSQSLYKKFSMPNDDKQVSSITGQPISNSKGSRVSLPQARLLTAKGLDNTVKELIDVRGGNTGAYHDATRQMSETGSFSLDEIESDTRAKSINIVASIFRSMMIDNTL